MVAMAGVASSPASHPVLSLFLPTDFLVDIPALS